MRKPHILSLAGAALVAASPLPLMAQDAPYDAAPDAEASIGDMADKMGDPELQAKLSRTLQAFSTILLDMPLAPLAEAAAEMTGEDPADVDPDMTLRRMSPEAERIPDEIAENVPQMMDAMSGMARGFEAMLPAFKVMVAQMEDAMDEAGEGRR